MSRSTRDTALNGPAETFLREAMECAQAIACEAGAYLRSMRHGIINSMRKQDGSLVTNADLESNRIITAALMRSHPDIPVLSEESVAPPLEQRQQWSSYWLIDPLDGTREFLHGSEHYTVNIALIQDHHPVVGVVCVPFLDTCFTAAAGLGATHHDAKGGGKAISTRQARPGELHLVCSQRTDQNPLKRLLSKLPRPVAITRMGSSLKSCLVAKGDFDGHFQFGRTSYWDTAAPQCIVQEAGGTVCRISTPLEPLNYAQQEDFLNPPFCVLGDLQYDWNTPLSDLALDPEAGYEH